MYSIHVKVDTNDADYITEISDITEQELELIRPLIVAIKNCKEYHNYPKGEYVGKRPQDVYSEYDFSEEVFEAFEELCPYNEYGFHTVESVELYPKVKMIEKLL